MIGTDFLGPVKISSAHRGRLRPVRIYAVDVGKLYPLRKSSPQAGRPQTFAFAKAHAGADAVRSEWQSLRDCGGAASMPDPPLSPPGAADTTVATSLGAGDAVCTDGACVLACLRLTRLSRPLGPGPVRSNLI